MPMAASEIERLIRDAIPDAVVTITDLRGDGDHYAARVVSASFAGLPRVRHQPDVRRLQSLGWRRHVERSRRCVALQCACQRFSICLMATLDELADRIERLVLRHDELKRTTALLEDKLATVGSERDNLKSRLAAARARIDALLERLPAGSPDDSRG